MFKMEVFFHVTGFGKFLGVDDNPSGALVRKLVAAVSHLECNFKLAAVPLVADVSTAGASDVLFQLRHEHERNESAAPAQHIWLHFGVAAGAPCYYLEQCAINDMSFRVPDEAGYQPRAVPIDPTQPFGAVTYTFLVVKEFVLSLRKKGYPVQASRDPGRFLCNWIYYKSLGLCAELNATYNKETAASSSSSAAAPTTAVDQDKDKSATTASLQPKQFDPTASRALPRHVSLFVHVPGTDVVDVDSQVRFALDLMTDIAKSVRGGPAAAASTLDELLSVKSLGDMPWPESTAEACAASRARRQAAAAAEAGQIECANGAGSGTSTSGSLDLGHTDIDNDEEEQESDAVRAAKSGDVRATLASSDLAATAGHGVLRGAVQAPATAAAATPAHTEHAAPAPPSGPLYRALLDLGFEPASCAAASNALGPVADLDAAVEWVLAYQSGGANGVATTAAAAGGGGGGGGCAQNTTATSSAAPSYNLDGVDNVLKWMASLPAGASSLPKSSGAAATSIIAHPIVTRAKMVIVVRGDLGMSEGKVAAQACHAALKAQRHLSKLSDYAPVMSRWEGSGEAIVVLRGTGLDHITALRTAARDAGLPTFVVHDAGRTQVEPGSLTVLAIGPADESRVDAITGRLRLL